MAAYGSDDRVENVYFINPESVTGAQCSARAARQGRDNGRPYVTFTTLGNDFTIYVSGPNAQAQLLARFGLAVQGDYPNRHLDQEI